MSQDEIGYLKQVYVKYNSNFILENINLNLYSSEFITIIGPNGSGKTTLLKTILGILKPTKGIINLFGYKNGSYPKGYIGYLPQSTKQNIQFPAKVFDIVMMGRYPIIGVLKIVSKEDTKIVEKCLEMLNIYDYKDENFQELSGGLKQRVLIARALSTEPKLLVLDEPSTSLDVIAQQDLYKTLSTLKGNGMSIIVVSHDIGVITMYVDKIVCLNKTIHYYGKYDSVIPPEVLEKVFGKNIMFIVHDKECLTCMNNHDRNIN